MKEDLVDCGECLSGCRGRCQKAIEREEDSRRSYDEVMSPFYDSHLAKKITETGQQATKAAQEKLDDISEQFAYDYLAQKFAKTDYVSSTYVTDVGNKAIVIITMTAEEYNRWSKQ